LFELLSITSKVHVHREGTILLNIIDRADNFDKNTTVKRLKQDCNYLILEYNS